MSQDDRAHPPQEKDGGGLLRRLFGRSAHETPGAGLHSSTATASTPSNPEPTARPMNVRMRSGVSRISSRAGRPRTAHPAGRGAAALVKRPGVGLKPAAPTRSERAEIVTRIGLSSVLPARLNLFSALSPRLVPRF